LPCFAQLGIGLACRSGHELGSFPAISLQLRVSTLVRLHRRLELRTRSGGHAFGRPLDVGLRQLTGGAGPNESGLLACMAQELTADALGRGAKGGYVR